MKKFLTLILISGSMLSISNKGNAQTLKITSIETTDPAKYQEMAKRHLGRTITLKFYDNAVSFNEEGREPLYMRKVQENEYQYYVNSTSEEDNIVIDLHYTVGVLTSLTITATTKNKNGGYTNTVTGVAKRF